MTPNYLASNLRVLRKRTMETQKIVASKAFVSRSGYNCWEMDITSPPIEKVLLLSDYFKISIDHLLKTDLRKMNEFELRQITN